MPQVGAHILISDETKAKLGDPGYLRRNIEAYHLGAIGPDLALLVFDRAGMEILLDEIVSVYETIHGIKEQLSEAAQKIQGPAEEMADWLTAGLSTQLTELISLSFQALKTSIEITMLPGTSTEVPNPFAGMDIPGMPNGNTIPIQATDLSRLLRNFGHPYSNDPPFITPQPPGSYDNWWWVDLLHYRRTGVFAQKLLSTARGDVLKAYATGYMTHVAGDICGHPFVNGVVGGPYRTHALRHLVIENLLDAWIWNHYTNGDLTKSKLHEQIDVGDQIGAIVKHLRKTMKAVYTDHGIVPHLLPGSLPSEADLKRAYDLMRTLLALSTDIDLQRPTPPPASPGAVIREVVNHVSGSFWNITEQFDSDNSWWEWLLAPFLAGAWALVTLFEIATIPAEVIARMAAGDLRWLIYLIELALYELASDLRWQLVLGGWGKPSTDDLGRAYAQVCFRVPTQRTGLAGMRCYPQRAVDHNTPGFWLADPGFSHLTVERSGLASRGTECCPYAKAPPFADTFMSTNPYDMLHNAILRRFAVADTPDKTLDSERATCQSSQLGNAPDFAVMLINGQYPLGSFDLDADMGYGFQSWEPGPVNYKPEFSHP